MSTYFCDGTLICTAGEGMDVILDFVGGSYLGDNLKSLGLGPLPGSDRLDGPRQGPGTRGLQRNRRQGGARGSINDRVPLVTFTHFNKAGKP